MVNLPFLPSMHEVDLFLSLILIITHRINDVLGTKSYSNIPLIFSYYSTNC